MSVASTAKIVDTECPGCKKRFGTAVNMADLEVAIGSVQKDQGLSYDAQLKEIAQELRELKQSKQKAIEEPAEKPKSEKKELVMPSYLPRHFCKGPGCPGHENSNYSERVKKRCTRCNMAGVPADTKTCPMCGNQDPDFFEELSDDDLDELNIPKPSEKEEHQHVH